MDIIVCVKQVPDTAAEIYPTADGAGIVTADLPWAISPYDEYALEEALRIREREGGTVTAICMGPDRAEAVLRTAAAMGADTIVHLNDPAFEGSDPHASATVLAAAIRPLPHDLIWCGKMAVDDAAGCVGAALGELLGLPHIAAVVKVELAGGKVTAHRETEAGTAVVSCPLPAVLTAEKGLNEPRYPKAMDIMKAKRKEVQKQSLAGLGLEAAAVGPEASPTHVVKFVLPATRGGGTVIEGTFAEAVVRLVQALRDEAKAL